jgi:glycosyltransferase involved in cell wall biosynthesis
MSTELVSVIVPTYNRAYCLQRALDSALGQTHRAVEVLVVDDGSTDRTAELIRAQSANEPRLRYIYQRNQGVSEARNAGIRAARGEFVALLDSDDFWYPWKLEAQLAALRRFPEVGMVWTDMEAVDADGRITDPLYLRTMYYAYRQFRNEDLFTSRVPLRELAPSLGAVAEHASAWVGEIFSQMIVGNLVHTSTVVLRRDCLGKVGFFNPEFKYAGEDYDFHLRTCREAPVAFINVASIQYQRGFADHLSREEHKVHLALNFLKAITPFLEHDRARIQHSDAKIHSILADAHRWVGRKALNSGNGKLAREHFGKSLRHQWLQPQYAALWLLTWLPGQLEGNLRRGYRSAKSCFPIPPAKTPSRAT